MEEYEAPTFEVIGSVEELTLHTTQGTRLDNGFQAGTLLSEITLS